MKRIAFACILVVALSLGVFQVAFAHAKLDHCTPDVGATVAQAPGQVVCVMSEEIDTKLSTLSVWDAGGVQVDKQDAHVDLNDPDHKTLIVAVDPASMKDGVYTVKYHTVTPDDGGVTDGTFQFIAGSAPAASTQALTTTVVTSTMVMTPTAAAPSAVVTSTMVMTPTAAAPSAVVTPTLAATPTVAPAAATPAAQPTPAALPATGGSQAAGLMIGLGLLGLALAGSGVVIRRFVR